MVCFNPRPRVGGDAVECAELAAKYTFQSTPPRGGRRISWRCARVSHVSIHAPAWGATHEVFYMQPSSHGFNPRPRVGGDSGCGGAFTDLICFNPRPRVGGDGTFSLTCSAIDGFNPRPRVGGDKMCFGFRAVIPGFNPRPRVGGD